MDDASFSRTRQGRLAAQVPAILTFLAVGCTPYVGTTAKSFLGHVRKNPDPDVRYVAYSKLASPRAYDSEDEKAEAVRVLMDRYEKGNEPLAIRAVICRTLGELRNPTARDLILKATNHPEPVIKIEACRALGKVGKTEDATVLARIMTLDHLEDARIAAIEGLAELKADDPRIYQMLIDAMDHEDPAIRLASVEALRKITGKDKGIDPAAWKHELEPILAKAPTPSPAEVVGKETAKADESVRLGGGELGQQLRR